MGAAYGTAKSGIGIAGVGTFRSDLIMKVGIDAYTWENVYGILTVSSVTNSSGHVWYHCCIRTRRGSPHCRQHEAPATADVQLVQRLPSPWMWIKCGTYGSSSRIRDRYRGRFGEDDQPLGKAVTGELTPREPGSEGIHATITSLRGNGTHTHFWGGAGSVWVRKDHSR